MSDDGIIGPGFPYWHLYGPLIEELRAENAKLRVSCAPAALAEAEEEIAKLRAALEEIIKWDDYAHTAKVARAALEETK